MPPKVVASKQAAVAAASATAVFMLPATAAAQWSVVEKTIPELHQAYASGQATVGGVVQQYLDRINQFSYGPGGVNAVAQLNPFLRADTARVQQLIASGASITQYPLLGVPVLVKDSYDAAGMTTTNGVSVLNRADRPDLKWTDMRAGEDAFSVARLKAAGAIILGKANLSTMAYSFNGIDNAHGVPLNPYNPRRQPGGSSSGSGVAVASNMAMMTMGGETGGSIRIPSNANALVGLKTSVGLIDPGGTWPLTPSRDVVGPMAKTVTDVAYAMNALVAPSPNNLFNGTPFYPTAAPGTVRPADYRTSLSTTALQGKVLAVPNTMVVPAGTNGTQYEGTVAPQVLANFNRAVADLRAQGATVVYVDLPAERTYYTTIGRGTRPTTTGFPYDFPSATVTDANPGPPGTPPSPPTTRVAPDNTWSTQAAAFYYQKQIESYNNPTIKNLRDFATALQNGVITQSGDQRSGLGTRTVNATTGAVTYTGAAGNIDALAAVWEAGNARGFGDANNDGAPDNPDARRALQAFASLKRDQYEGYMRSPNLPDDPGTTIDESTLTIDAFVAPTYGTVMPLQTAILAASDRTDPYAVTGGASLLARLEGNLLGAPAISVPMGYAPDGTPMGIQFFDELLGEAKLLGFAYDYEQATLWRRAPDLSFVPEPGSFALLVVGGLALAVRRPRRQGAAA